MDELYKAALIKTRNEGMAEDLVQETCLYALQAISKGTDIQNPKAYLLSVLQNRFFMHMREKYKTKVVYFGDIPEPSGEADFGELERSQEAEYVRRELAFLSHTYREVMIRYYMKNESVGQIAENLGIPKGTVLSRLDVGRKKIRKGVEKMENYNSNNSHNSRNSHNSYNENSYCPETLTIGINGRTGQNGEPFSCINGLLDQNILITAYEKPLTISEISRALGTPMPFIEESVNKLVNTQLMTQEGTKVATGFIIKNHEDKLKAIELSKGFAKENFDKINAVIMKGVERYKDIKGFSAFNKVQKYVCAAFSMKTNIESFIYEAAMGKPTMKPDTYPDRPNYGKWIAIGSRYPHGYSFDDELQKYGISGYCVVDGVNEHIRFFL
jgi:RNA polymerase sigma-70 factor (ECF subfamily)